MYSKGIRLIQCNRFLFSKTILDILSKNKLSIIPSPVHQHRNNIPTSPLSHSGTIKSHSSTPETIESREVNYNKKPYRTVNQEYIRSNSDEVEKALMARSLQLRKLANKLAANEYLVGGDPSRRGQELQGYTLQKIIQISLSDLNRQLQSEEKWEKIEKRIYKLLRNPSVEDNILLLFISTRKGWKHLQSVVLAYIAQQFEYLTESEHLLLFFTICQCEKQSKISSQAEAANFIPALLGLKQKLVSNALNCKLPLTTVISWAMVSAVNHKNDSNLRAFVQKILRYGSLNMVSVENLINFLVCMDLHNTPVDHQQMGTSKEKVDMKTLLEVYKEIVGNYETLWRSLPSDLNAKIKMYNSFCFPEQPESILTTVEILTLLSPSQALKYVHWMWKKDLKNIFELQNIKQGIDLTQFDRLKEDTGNHTKFAGIDALYYLCWLELGLGQNNSNSSRIHQIISKISMSLDYCPRELEWPLFNYFYSRQQAQGGFQAFQSIFDKIGTYSSNQNRKNLIAGEIEAIIQSAPFLQFKKFVHEVQLWNFEPIFAVGPVSYLAHFVDQSLRVLVHCYKGPEEGLSSSGEQKLSPEMQLNRTLLKKNFNYGIIYVNITVFKSFSINQRIMWLKSQVFKHQCQNRGISQNESPKNIQ